MRFAQSSAAAMANMENDDGIALDGEQHPVQMRLAPIEELTHLERKLFVFRRERTALGKLGKGRYLFSQSPKPAQASFTRLPLQEPIQDIV